MVAANPLQALPSFRDANRSSCEWTRGCGRRRCTPSRFVFKILCLHRASSSDFLRQLAHDLRSPSCMPNQSINKYCFLSIFVHEYHQLIVWEKPRRLCVRIVHKELTMTSYGGALVQDPESPHLHMMTLLGKQMISKTFCTSKIETTISLDGKYYY
jgi:hypothetical protein